MHMNLKVGLEDIYNGKLHSVCQCVGWEQPLAALDAFDIRIRTLEVH